MKQFYTRTGRSLRPQPEPSSSSPSSSSSSSSSAATTATEPTSTTTTTLLPNETTTALAFLWAWQQKQQHQPQQDADTKQAHLGVLPFELIRQIVEHHLPHVRFYETRNTWGWGGGGAGPLLKVRFVGVASSAGIEALFVNDVPVHQPLIEKKKKQKEAENEGEGEEREPEQEEYLEVSWEREHNGVDSTRAAKPHTAKLSFSPDRTKFEGGCYHHNEGVIGWFGEQKKPHP